MNRIKLPGNEKTKKILLIILVCFSIVIIGKVAIDNRNAKIEREHQEQLEQERIADEEEQARIAEEERIKKEKEEQLYNDAFSVFHNKQYAEAIAKAEAIIQEFPESYKAYSIRGIAKAYNGSFDEGMKDIDKALEIEPNYGYGRFNKALNYELFGKFDDALIWYDKALEVEQYVWIYYGKASIYGRQGNVKDAVSNLKLAISIAKDDEAKNGIKEAARQEADFDPINGEKEFQDLIK